MNIGLAAEASGLPPKTIRYYEEIGLVRSDRRGNNYRDYSDKALHNLRFLARARALGFSIEECRQLLSLYADKDRASADVRGLAKAHMKEIDAKIRELQAMKGTLSKLVQACHGDEWPDCPILEDLAGTGEGRG
ncbi:MAG: Cu(I)-responsive transcriptional regulator [Pseudomonadota bacterium]|nr:Cu(I)-responsive transcriptional regulator [Pseudomonadota bacterium]